MALEYRVCWSASSNIGFKGASDWEKAFDEDITADELEDDLGEALGGRTSIPESLEIALEASGFEWWVETREAAQ